MEIFGSLVLIVGVALYFMPAMVANSREHPNTAAISVLNFFLGWTFLGWVIALSWACTATRQSSSTVAYGFAAATRQSDAEARAAVAAKAAKVTSGD